jgi:hypothetical protein
MMNQMQMAGPMPGQAQGIQQVLPGMMPKQGAPTPQAMVGPLSQMHLQQLTQMMLNPRPEGPPLYAVLSAITEKQKQAQAQASMQRQMAMAQGQQAAQQPPVAQEVLAQAQQMQAEEPVMAAYGGEMQGYAGGGAVAFAGGAGPQGLPQQNPEEDLSDDPGLPLRERMIRAEKRRALSRQQGIGRSFAERFPDPAQSTTDTGDEVTRMLGRAPAPVPMAMQDTRGVTPDTVAAARTLGAGQPQQRPPAAPPATAPGIAGLMGPTAPAGLIERRGTQSDIEKALMEGSQVPAEVLRARAEAQKIRQGIGGFYGEEEKRRTGYLDKLVADAQARAGGDRFSNPEILGRMLRGAMAAGPKGRFGDVLAGMGAGAAEGVASLQNAVAAAEEKRALGQERMFDLRMRREQLRLDEQNLLEANASKDQDRINTAKNKVAESRQLLAESERKAIMEERKFGLDERQVAVQEAGLKLRQDEAKRGPAPSFQDQMARSAIEDWLKKNPGKSYSDAVEWWRGAGKGVEGRERLGNLKLASETLSKRLEDLRLSKDERDRINNQLQGVQTEILSLLGMSGASSAPVAGGVVTPKSQAEFNALPKGARYINPADGKEYIKN